MINDVMYVNYIKFDVYGITNWLLSRLHYPAIYQRIKTAPEWEWMLE